MSYHRQEIPAGGINGVNKVFTTLSDVYVLDQVEINGLTYYGNVAINGSQLTLDDAPTVSVYVWYWDSAPVIPQSGSPITLGELKSRLTFAVGTAETNLMTNDKRVNAINKAIENILETYAIPQYTVKTQLNFVNGAANLPLDCLLPFKLVSPTQPTIVYSQASWDIFPQNIPQTFCITYDQVQNAEMVKIYPATTIALDFYYLQMPAPLVNDEDTIRLKQWWVRAIAEKAAEELFLDTRNFNAAEGKTAVARDLMAKAWQMDRARIEGIQNQRLTSIYSKQSLISQNRI